jgi:hypothetical protein
MLHPERPFRFTERIDTMHGKQLALAGLVIVGMGALLVARNIQDTPAADKMAKAANAFLEQLPEDQNEQARFNFEDKERLNWHFIPRERKGLPLRDLSDDDKQRAHALIASGLSESGYSQALDIMSLEEVLYLLEEGEREMRRERRHPGKYYISIFGEPSNEGTWGWRVEGHHLSLNYTIENGKVVSSTPEFYGANPGLIDAGPGRSIRVLGTEEDLARQILKLCDEEQQKLAWIAKEAPDDLRGGGELQPVVTKPQGLTVSKMSADQKKLLQELLSEYLKNMPADVERARRDRINQSGFDNTYFAWWGSSEPNERHYYVIQGETFIIEYNNTQNSANHVHSMWRNIDGDFHIKREEQ